MMNGHGKSDRPEVPAKSPNKAGPLASRDVQGLPAAEGMEGRGLAKGNPPRQNALRTPSRNGANCKEYVIPARAPYPPIIVTPPFAIAKDGPPGLRDRGKGFPPEWVRERFLAPGAPAVPMVTAGASTCPIRLLKSSDTPSVPPARNAIGTNFSILKRWLMHSTSLVRPEQSFHCVPN